MLGILTRIFRELMPLLSWYPAECLQNIANGLRLKEHSISSPTLSSQTCWVLCSTWKMLLTDSLSDASPGEFSYRASFPPPKKNNRGGCGTLWRAPLEALPSPTLKKKRRGKEEKRDHMRPWRMLLRRLPYRLHCFLSLLKRLFSFRLLVANCTKRSQWTRRTLTRKKKRDDDLSWTICVFMSHEWCCLFHSVASTRNLGVVPLMLWTPLILRRYLTIVCFWLWCCPACSFWLQHQLVASRCSTFAPERLIGIFWVRRRILSRPPCVQNIV